MGRGIHRGALVGALFLVAVACDQQPASDWRPFTRVSTTGPAGARCEDLGRAGGVVEVPLPAGSARLTVPAWALDEPQTVCLEPVSTLAPTPYPFEAHAVRVAPSELVFRVPPRVTFTGGRTHEPGTVGFSDGPRPAPYARTGDGVVLLVDGPGLVGLFHGDPDRLRTDPLPDRGSASELAARRMVRRAAPEDVPGALTAWREASVDPLWELAGTDVGALEAAARALLRWRHEARLFDPSFAGEDGSIQASRALLRAFDARTRPRCEVPVDHWRAHLDDVERLVSIAAWLGVALPRVPGSHCLWLRIAPFDLPSAFGPASSGAPGAGEGPALPLTFEAALRTPDGSGSPVRVDIVAEVDGGVIEPALPAELGPDSLRVERMIRANPDADVIAVRLRARASSLTVGDYFSAEEIRSSVRGLAAWTFDAGTDGWEAGWPYYVDDRATRDPAAGSPGGALWMGGGGGDLWGRHRFRRTITFPEEAVSLRLDAKGRSVGRVCVEPVDDTPNQCDPAIDLASDHWVTIDRNVRDLAGTTADIWIHHMGGPVPPGVVPATLVDNVRIVGGGEMTR
ncbi:MAG TPA: hypothetical protein RMF84_08435 [Polyangiaceae bacterium LLY-WYZ-14_1]|nr:hypothetical protein [Polyangiaceae bacterium LLY-WYZ-14_1]